MTDPAIGMRLDEYILEGLLGQGGMARVYRALDTGLHRYAAIKVIDTPHQHDEAYITRFEREAQAIAQLHHPHIVTLYRYGNTGQLLYLAMQYIEGADLHAVLTGYERDREFMEPDEVVRLIGEIGAAIDYAHTHGVIHRDIKPSNVLLDADGRAYLTDFGLALLTDEGTRGDILGSPRYIAPEQAASSAGAVNQSDVYSLGVILYRMVTGRVPFEHGDTLGLLTQHMTQEPTAPSLLRPGISPALETVILKSLAKKPEDRYATAGELAQAVERRMTEGDASTVFPSAVSSLSIIDRVALNMEALPPPSTTARAAAKAAGSVDSPAAGSAPMATSPPAAPALTAAKRKPAPMLWIGAGIVLLLILAGALLLLREDGEEITAAVSPGPSPTPSLIEATDSAEANALPPPSLQPLPTSTVVTIATEPLPTESLPTEPSVPAPTDPPLPDPTNPVPTVAPVATPSGPRLMMFYNLTSFYLYNPNRDMDIRVSELSFESLDENGELSGYWLEGSRWSQFYSFVESFGCVILEVTKADGWLRPSQCRVNNAVITPAQEDDMVFWTQRAGVAQFRILWQGNEIGRCDVTATQCEVYLP